MIIIAPAHNTAVINGAAVIKAGAAVGGIAQVRNRSCLVAVSGFVEIGVAPADDAGRGASAAVICPRRDLERVVDGWGCRLFVAVVAPTRHALCMDGTGMKPSGADLSDAFQVLRHIELLLAVVAPALHGAFLFECAGVKPAGTDSDGVIEGGDGGLSVSVVTPTLDGLFVQCASVGAG